MADGYWICSKCSWVNKSEEASAGCKACGKLAPPGTAVSAPPDVPSRVYHPSPSAPSDPTPYRPVSHVPPPQQQQQKQQVPDNLWLCSKCSWVNQLSDGSCRACGQLAPPGTKQAAAPPPAVYHPSAAVYNPPPPAVYHRPPPASVYNPPTPAVYHTPAPAVYHPPTPAVYHPPPTPAATATAYLPTPVATPVAPVARPPPNAPSYHPPQKPVAVPVSSSTPQPPAQDDFVSGFASHSKYGR